MFRLPVFGTLRGPSPFRGCGRCPDRVTAFSVLSSERRSRCLARPDPPRSSLRRSRRPRSAILAPRSRRSSPWRSYLLERLFFSWEGKKSTSSTLSTLSTLIPAPVDRHRSSTRVRVEASKRAESVALQCPESRFLDRSTAREATHHRQGHSPDPGVPPRHFGKTARVH